MNFNEIKQSIELVLATQEVPLIVGDSGIGKTALAQAICKEKDWYLISIDGNLLKEGEIGGLPTVETLSSVIDGKTLTYKTTVYAVHHKLYELDSQLAQGKTVLLFIDEINRCEHSVQQELMNLILNREINGFRLHPDVKIMAAMNPSAKYGTNFDYQVVDMDAAQENRFVWLRMESDPIAWLNWAMENRIDEKVIAFISTFPEYLYHVNEDSIRATPRSYERLSKAYQVYQKEANKISRSAFYHVVEGNVGKMIAEVFMSFVEHDYAPLLTYEDVFLGDVLHENIPEKIMKETHTRLYLTARNILREVDLKLEHRIDNTKEIIGGLSQFFLLYPMDLRVGIMKDIKRQYHQVYTHAIEEDTFLDLYFKTHEQIWG